MKASDFPNSFYWGVSSAAYQTEGAWNTDGKGPSVWDEFTSKPGKIYQNQHARVACDFYHRYAEDLDIIRTLNIPHFRFSLAWSRIFPEGTGKVNQKGVDFYNRLIDACLEKGITPWVTLYHWDLPQRLEEQGGWTNREITDWFGEYVQCCARNFGDRVTRWMVLNEPLVFTGAGYFAGVHAPGRKGIKNFLPAVHHAALCQSFGAGILKSETPQALVGTTFSGSLVTPASNQHKHRKAAQRVNTLFNHLFLQPLMGKGYPTHRLPALNRIEQFMRAGDEAALAYPMDFIGLQIYTRVVIRHNCFTPYIRASLVPAEKRNVPITDMDWEIYPYALYKVVKDLHAEYNLPSIIITENGAALPDPVENGKIKDIQRQRFLEQYIDQVARLRKDGLPVNGYFVWTLLDNFEWAEGYKPRFGIVRVDFKTQQRTIKQSGYWYKKWLTTVMQPPHADAGSGTGLSGI